MSIRTSLFGLAIVLAGCAGTPQASADLPAELPHYPCERLEGGKTVYFACPDQEWLHQQILKGKP